MKKIKGYIKTKELRAMGLRDKDIKNLLADGSVLKIKQGLYREAVMFSQNQSFIDINAAAPKAVISGLSALSYYNLTTFMPSKVTIAIPRGSTPPKISYPPNEISTSAKSLFDIEIKEVKEGPYFFRIYSIERAVCDSFRRINKIGVDIAKESLVEYMKRKDKDINKLYAVAEKCKVKNKIVPWIMALI
jgi:predicted transcriptional regulator of viral defense system